MTNDIYDPMQAVCAALEACGLDHAVTGSIASSVHGEPHSTLDVDICLRLGPQQIDELIRRIPRRFYCSRAMVEEAVANCTMVNLIDNESPYKVDLSILPAEPFYKSVLSRRKKIVYGPDGPVAWTVTPEDIILMKLLWRKDTLSQKQWENALSVAQVWGARLDWRYMREWGGHLAISEDLQKLMVAADI